MGQVIFSATNLSHNIIVGNGAYTKYTMTQTGTFPSTSYTITNATITYNCRTADNGNVYGYFLVNRTNEPTAQLGRCNAAGRVGDITEALTTSKVYEELTDIILKGDGGIACQLKGGTQITITVDYELNRTDATAPTYINYSANPFDTSCTVSWGGAAAGLDNSIVSYNLLYAVSVDGGTTWTQIIINTTNTSYTIDTSALPSQALLKCAVATVAQYNTTGYYSGAAVQKITITTPTAPTVLEGTAIFEEALVLSWSGAYAGTNNAIVGYKIAYAYSVDANNWEAEVEEEITVPTFTIDTASKSRGMYIHFRVLTIGERSNSAYSEYSANFRKNQLPPTPTITIPAQTNTIVYEGTSLPVAAIFGDEPDGQAQTLYVSINGKDFIEASNNRITIRKGEKNTVKFATFDGLALSESTETYSITWRTTGMPTTNPTTVAAQDINNMRECINNIRNYRGYENYTFTDTIVSGGIVKAQHFQELQAAMPWGTFDKIKQNDLIKASHYNQLLQEVKQNGSSY